jgi:dynein heavy chain
VVKLTDGDYLRTLENAIQFGLPVLLENVMEELDPSLEPLLLKQIFKQGGVECIRLGDSIIEYSKEFKFYITTTMRNPHYLPETAVKVTLLNFMITTNGLADQLLGVVVAEERPDLEEQRSQLVVQSAANKRKLQEIENQILHVLSSSEGNILEDASAVQILTEAKVVSTEIEEKQKVAEVTEKEIEEARLNYTSCGAYTAVLFFAVADMANIDPMYQYSLGWFVRLFVRSITDSREGDGDAEDISARLTVINDHFTFSLYTNVCMSLFERDKLLFAFLLCSRIMNSEGSLDPAAWAFLLTGGVGLTEKDELPNPAADWLSDKSWDEIRRLSSLTAFDGLAKEFTRLVAGWREIYDSLEPHKAAMPGQMGAACAEDPFMKVILLRCIRRDKVVPAVHEFVAGRIGTRFVEPPPFDLAKSYKESSATTPLLFVLSPGSDPTAALLKFADDAGFGARLSAISMGQGQGPKAATMISEATKAGLWVLLQNCHLAPSWMPALERVCEGFKPDTVDPDFRLWMTSYPTPKFPVTILQNSVKMTNEPPTGMRANLKRTFLLDPIANKEFFEGCNKPEIFKNLCFGLAFVHGFVQERRKFGPLGWNIPYGFDDGDLRISVRQLQMFIDENEQIPFAALKYATGECNYGGRVTDDKDRLLLNTLLDRVYRDEIMQPSFNLSASGLYYVPPAGDHASYMAFIDTLPANQTPEVFGLHDNADIAKDAANTSTLLESLLVAGGSGAGGSGKSEERVVAGIVEDVLRRLPPNFDLEKAQAKYPVLYEESMNQVLCQEMLRYNKLLSVVRSSLQNLDKALQGLQVMSAALEVAFRSLAVGAVPAMWMKSSFPCLKGAAGYIQELLDRLAMLQSWYEDGPPAIFWVSGFFFTPAFLTAGLQNFARKNSIPIDEVDYDFHVLGLDAARYSTAPEAGVYIKGLFLEGCGYDPSKAMLCESVPKVLHVPAPIFWLEPRRLNEMSEFPHFNCPVYRTADRRGVLATTGHSTNFLRFMRFPSDEPQHHWILRGVCMLSSLPD